MTSHQPAARAERTVSQSANEAEVARMKVLRDARVRALLARCGAPMPPRSAAADRASAALTAPASGGDLPIGSAARRHPV
jgi:hypothetical protein